jgi:hypothetical protein
LTVVIDIGIHEVRDYDFARDLDFVQEELIPEVHCEERGKLVAQTDNGLAKNLVHLKPQMPEVKRLDLSRSFLRLWRLNYRFSDLQNLPNQPQTELLSDCQEQFRRC